MTDFIKDLAKNAPPNMFTEIRYTGDQSPTHTELIPNGVGDWHEVNVPNGYHYELQELNGLWQWIVVKDKEEV